MTLSSALYRASRRNAHRISAVTILENWRERKREEVYARTSWCAKVILPDAIITKIAANSRILIVADLEATLDRPWLFAAEHGDEVLALLTQLDLREQDSQEYQHLANRETKHLQTLAEQQEEDRS